MKKVLVGVVLLLISLPVSVSSLPVFPKAEGFGTQTPAGRGGTVYKVTNLDSSGPGSLRECVEASGPRVCVFEVSGNIEHYGGLNIRNPYITIAGQTAPSPGITLKGTSLTILTHDVLIQHIRVRTGDNESGYSPDSRHTIYFPSSASPYNVVMDHCSFSWGIDEIMSVMGYNITVSNSIISEGLNHSLHPKGPHALGILLGADNSSWIRNLIAHTANRNPVVDAPNVLMVNHIGYNLVGKYGCAPTISGTSSKKGTVVGSGTYRGPDSGSGEFPCVNATYLVYVNKVSSSGFDLYAEDNECENRDEDPWSCVYVYAGNVRQASSPPVWVEPLTVLSSAEALPWVLNNSGARPADRDSADIRVVNNVINKDGQFIDCVTPEPIYYPTGSVVSATSDTITFPAATIFMYDDGYNGKEVEITSGTGSGQIRTITDYAGKFGFPGYEDTNYTAIVDPAWDIIPDSTSEFRIITDCTKNAGGWPDLAENYRSLTLPNNPNGDDDGDGYTNLEEWLHGFSDQVEGKVVGNIYYVRPEGGNYGNEDGSSYANAWDGLGSIVWGTGGVEAGDTLYVCGFHLRTRTGGSAWQVFSPQISGTDNSRITIRGDCPGDQGIIWGAGIMAHEPWVNEGGGVWSITAVGTPNSMWYFEDIKKDSWKVLNRAYSLSECQNTPGSFYSNDYNAGSKLYVHPFDSSDPTNRIAANRLGYHLIMNDKHYITWLNLKFYSIYRWVEAGATDYGILTHMRWENCTIWYGESIHFLFRNGNHHLEFIDCDIGYSKNGIGFAEYPIGSGSMSDGSEPRDSVIRGCTFHHIGLPYGDPDAHAVSGQGSRNILIENNEMYLVGSGVTFYCYNTNQSIKNITVRYNWIHDTHSNCENNDPTRCANSRGIEFNTGPAQGPGTSAVVYGNIVGPNVSSVCYRYFWTELGEFYNNVAYDCGTSFYIHHSLSPVNARIKNCISVNPTDYHIRYSNNNDSSLTSLDSDYNIFYPVDQDKFFIHVPEERLTDVSFSEWQTLSIPRSVFDPHSLTLDPLFLNPSNNNFHLHQDSPAIDNGTNVGLTKDYDGNPIPQGSGFDIGAYEFLSGFTLLGDLNGDGYVDIADLAIVAIYFGRRNIHTQWNATADVSASNEIDVYDLVFVGSRFT